MSLKVKDWCVSLIDDLRRFFARSGQERRLFIEAYVLLGVMRAAILLMPFRKITGMMGLVQCECLMPSPYAAAGSTEHIGWAIQAAAARTPWESACLAQALTGMLMLIRRGGTATIILGVAKDDNGSETMKAHAWLRCGGTVVTGAAGSDGFVPISGFTRC